MPSVSPLIFGRSILALNLKSNNHRHGAVRVSTERCGRDSLTRHHRRSRIRLSSCHRWTVCLQITYSRPNGRPGPARHGPLGHGPLGTAPVAGRAVPAHVPRPRPKHGPRRCWAVPGRHGYCSGTWAGSRPTSTCGP